MPSGMTMKTVTRSLICRNLECGKTFEATQKASSRPHRYCSPSCQKTTANARARQVYRDNNPQPTLECKHCGSTFLRGGRKRAYCSNDCQKTAAYKRDKAAARKYPTKQISGVCRYLPCMAPFTREVKGRAPAYCSKKCQRNQLNVLRLMRLYDLSEDAVLARLVQGLCDLCGRPFESGKDRHFDHDHVTGAFRGVLHRACNMAIGNLEDDAGRALQAANYLQGGRAWWVGPVTIDNSAPNSWWYRDKATK